MHSYITLLSAEAWKALVAEYHDRGGRDATDHELAEMLRQKIQEVEG